jgi:hypothetical protein
MTEAIGECLLCQNFLEYLQGLPWCKQEQILVAVGPCSPEIIVAFGNHEVKVFPGGTNVKVNKSWLSYLQEKNEEGTPLPILLVWRAAGVEMWYRRHKSWEFPYDMWQNPVAEAYERECVFLPAAHGGKRFAEIYQELLGRVKVCPPQIPPQ